MSLTLDQLTNGLTPEHDYFFTEKPQDPEMRESTSVWLFDENGEFGFPRVAIEGEAHTWDKHTCQANVALGGGRVLFESERGTVPSPIGPDGKPSVFGAGALRFQCVQPFRKWAMVYDGTVYEGTVAEQIAGIPLSKKTTMRLEVELTMVTPAWIQDYSPEKLATMTKAEIDDAGSMGVGWRLEHLCRGEGELRIDGTTRNFKLVGSRIKRQSVRPMHAFRGHCWQSALFPDGRAFGFIAYPSSDTAPEYNIGYVYQNGQMYPARAKKIPFIRQLLESGDNVSFELESALGTHKISAVTCLSTFQSLPGGMGGTTGVGFALQQSGARYTWDGMTTYGMIERSASTKQMEDGYR